MTKHPTPVTIDFETFSIEGRPHYPPMPVGVSVKYPGKKSRYYAFGHPTENNCAWNEAVTAVAQAYQHKDGVLFQNGKFDVDVAEEWFELTVPEWQRIHDTMFLLFLEDPHQRELGLKESAARLLDWEAEEQDAVGEWLIKHQPVPGIKISRSKNSAHYFGRYIAFAPGKLVGEYANGDVDRTEALFNLLYPSIAERGMLEAYDRERELMPILLEMERQGVPVALARLHKDVALYTKTLERLNTWLIKKLKASPDLNLDSGAQLMDAMIQAGIVDETKVPLTPTGKMQTNKDALLLGVKNRQFLHALKYRAQLKTCLNTFMKPWLEVAERSGGLIYTTWNQVRAPKGSDTGGTRTGRLSSTPNFQNIPKVFEALFRHEQRGLPQAPFANLPPLPHVRSYIIPFEGEVLIDRDYSQQELRILGHVEGGVLMNKYLDNPWLDVHDDAKDELAKIGRYYDRKPVKNTNFGLIYGMGVGKLAAKNDMVVEEATDLKKAILNLYPGLRELYREMKLRAANDEPIRTWGGREYYCEPPALVQGRIRTFDYKLVNVLIQGSAADCTKEAIIKYHKVKHPDAKLILNVHDQITASVPKSIYKKEMTVLRDAMEDVDFDVPMLSEGSISTTNWDQLKDYDAKGAIL